MLEYEACRLGAFELDGTALLSSPVFTYARAAKRFTGSNEKEVIRGCMFVLKTCCNEVTVVPQLYKAQTRPLRFRATGQH